MWSLKLCNLCIGKTILYLSQCFTMHLQMWINVFQGFLPVEALILGNWSLGIRWEISLGSVEFIQEERRAFHRAKTKGNPT